MVLSWCGRAFLLHDGTNILGRDRSADVSIDSSGVSRRHAVLEIRGTAITIEDLGSKNGTFVAGVRIAGPVSIHCGAEIRLGSAILRILESS